MSGVLGNLEKRVVKRVENILGPKLDLTTKLLQKQNDRLSTFGPKLDKMIELLSEIVTLLKKQG